MKMEKKQCFSQMKALARELDRRVSGLEAVQVMMHQVQVESLKQAEKLRKLAIAVTNSQRGFQKSGRVSVNSAASRRLEEFLVDLKPFYKQPGPMPAALKRLLAQHRKAGR